MHRYVKCIIYALCVPMNSMMNRTGQTICWLRLTANSPSWLTASFGYVNLKVEFYTFRKTGAWHASAMCYSLNYYSAWDGFIPRDVCGWIIFWDDLFNHISPRPCSNRGMIRQTYLNSHTTTSPIPLPGSAFLLGQLWGGGVLGLSLGSPAALKSTLVDPTLLCIKRCKYCEVAVFQISWLSMAAGSHWQSPQEEDPRRKPRATVKHMLHKRTAGFSEQPCQP